MSSIAVFLILGGATAIAAKKIGANELKANSVKTGKIVKEAVVAGKIKNGAVITTKLGAAAVTNEKIADNAITTGKILNDAVTGDKVKESTLSTVPTATKAAEATKLTKVTVVKVDFTVASGSGNNTTRTATCPTGTQAISGGVRDDPFANTAAIVTSRPVIGEAGLPETGESFDGWRGSVTNTAAGVLNSTVWAICAG